MVTSMRVPFISRRTALTGLAAVPAGFGLSSPTRADARPDEGRQIVPSCVLTPQSVEGPFYFDPALSRSDITEGRAGVPLALRFVVVEAGRCRPLAGARIDIWHASAEGLYSGYARQGDDGTTDTTGGTFLRGTRVASEHGEALFSTIYPGWYRGRTTHIHFMVLVDQRNILTGQMYFPDALNAYIYANVEPYKDRTAKRDTFNSTDGIARMDKIHGGYCDIKEEPDRYLATLTVAADLSGVVLAEGPGRRPPGPGSGAGPGPGFGPPIAPRTKEPARIVPGVALSHQTRG